MTDRRTPLRARSPRWTRGDAGILYTFFILTIVLVGSLTIGGIVVTTLRASRDIGQSAQAFYAADSAIELGLNQYHAAENSLAPPSPPPWPCTDADGERRYLPNVFSTATLPGSFTVIVRGDGPEGSTCPTADELLGNPPPRALCVEAIGRSDDSERIRRRLRSDTNAQECD